MPPPMSASEVLAFLEWKCPPAGGVSYPRGSIVFAQGDRACEVVYIRSGRVKLSVVSTQGKETAVALLARGDFLGERCIAGEQVRTETATALTPTVVLAIEKAEMLRLLRTEPAMADRFIAHLLAHNRRIEADLVDQRFNRSEQRLARTLLRLAAGGTPDAPGVIPPISQAVLAEIVGTTRSRVNHFLNDFKRRGLIDYRSNRAITVKQSLSRVALRPCQGGADDDREGAVGPPRVQSLRS